MPAEVPSQEAIGGGGFGHAVDSLRRLPGGLFLAPLVALLLGSQWSWVRDVEPPSATYSRNTAGEGRAPAPVSIDTYLVPEGSQIHAGITLQPGESLTFELPRLRREFTLAIQGHMRDHYRMESGVAGGELTELWITRPLGSRGFRTRVRAFDPPAEPIDRLRVTPARNRAVRVAGIKLTYTVYELSHAVIAPVLWGLWLVLVVASKRINSAGVALELWHRWDAWLAALLVVSVLFVLAPEAVAIGFAVLAIGLVLRLVSFGLVRAPWLTVFYLVFSGLLLGVVVPRVIAWAAARRIAASFDLTVDHRMRPDGDEINSDGIRFLGEASDLEDDHFVILVLGDSFTYGLRLAYEDTYPVRLEQSLRAAGCSEEVRTVNYGWGSSSPLLSLRLLRDIGARYRPDLVIYTLDMTDFDDDLRYEVDLRRAGDLEIDSGKVVRQLATSLMASLPFGSRLAESLGELRRPPAEDSAAPAHGAARQRFFITNQPLERSRADIERGVMTNLAAIHRHATETLGVPMALVVYARSYQYSARESPRNWERGKYTRLGSHVREIFRYFKEQAPGLPYPVMSLLPAFENSEEFPLFFEDDPHWNEAGARLAAAEVADFLIASSLGPCRGAAAIADSAPGATAEE